MDFVNIEWIGPLYKALLKVRGGRKQQVSKIAEMFGDPVLLAKYYVEPHLQHWNPADLDEEQVGGRTELRTLAFAAFNEFFRGDIIQKRGRNQMFVQSDAGMGKSSLLVVFKTMHLMRFWPKGFNCELIKIDSDTIARIADIEYKNKTVLLLDALDEDLDSNSNIQERITELLVVSRNFYRVIITCRTQYFPEGKAGPFRDPGRVVVNGFACPVWFLSPFDDEKLQEYVGKKYAKPWYLPLQRRKAKQQIAIEMLQKMSSLRFRPFLASHLDDLIAAEDRQIGFESDVYDALIEVWLDREISKLAERREVGRLVDSGDLRDACRFIAVEMFLQGRHNIESSSLQTMAIADPRIRYLENFDFGGRSLLNRDSDRKYRFSHKSIQEYLIAESLALGYKSKEIISCQSVGYVVEKFYWQLFNSLRTRDHHKQYQWPICCCAVLPDSKLVGMSVNSVNRMFVKIHKSIATIVATRINGHNFQCPVNPDEEITSESWLVIYFTPELGEDFLSVYDLYIIDNWLEIGRRKRRGEKLIAVDSDNGSDEVPETELLLKLLENDKQGKNTISADQTPKLLGMVQNEYNRSRVSSYR